VAEHTQPGPLIAIIGSDGSGKSTVGDALLAWMQASRPTALCHLGKQSGNLGRAIGRLPVVGGGVGRSIDNRVRQAHEARSVSLMACLVIYAFALRRVARFRRMLALRRRGIAILADRFPQTAVPAALDGPGFARVRADHGIARRLASREAQQFASMIENRPDLVLRLNVDVATAIARKPDHDPRSLALKIADVHRLSFNGAPIVDLDANRPLDEVLAAAKAAVAPFLSSPA
jgi:thymidylate kinase